jgi:N-acetylglutamate synthase
MVSWPELGTRVTVRYRRRPESIPPLTDAVGHLLAVDPVVRVRTKTGAVVECAPADVVALRTLTDAPVRTSEIRALEYAVATASPGAEQAWLDGWLLRAAPDAEPELNSAVPLDISARSDSLPVIAAWYADRGMTPRLLIPDRLLPVPAGLTAERVERMLVRDVPLEDSPELGAEADANAARADARGETRAWIRVGDRDTDAIAQAASLGFRLHHRRSLFRLDTGSLDNL